MSRISDALDFMEFFLNMGGTVAKKAIDTGYEGLTKMIKGEEMVSPVSEGDTLPSPTPEWEVEEVRDKPTPTPTATPTATPTPTEQFIGPKQPPATPTPTPMANFKSVEDLQAAFDRGFASRGNPPLATRSAHMAQKGMELQESGLDPRLAYGIGIKETQGLKYPPSQKINNPYGIGPHKKFENIDASTSYFTDLMQTSPYYEDYRGSKDLFDLLKRYTPASDPENPAMKKQINDLLEFLGEVK